MNRVPTSPAVPDAGHDQQSTIVPSIRRDPLFFFITVGLVAIVTCAFLPVLRCGFVNFDDPDYVLENAHVQAGLNWAGVQWAFISREGGNWHPITWLSHMFDCQLYGLKAWGHHLTSLVFHLANTLLLFALFWRMTRAIWCSFFVAALFAVHPLHVESVAWISERKDVLSTFFGLISIWFYAAYAEGRNGRAGEKGGKGERENLPGSLSPFLPFYFLALLFFALSLMSKPMLVTLPFIFLLLDYWPLRRVTSGEWRVTGPETNHVSRFTFHVSRLIVEKLPFFALSVVSCAVTFWAQQSGGAVRSVAEFPLSLRFSTAVIAYASYIRKMFWPSDLAAFYPHPGSWPVWQTAGAAVLLTAICLVSIWTARRRPYFVTGWLWYLITLLPVIGLVPIGYHAMADRYTYVPLIGLFVMLAWTANDVASRMPNWRKAFASASVLLLVACVAATHVQAGKWQDSRTLFEHAVRVTGRNALAQYNLGVELAAQGDIEGARARFAASVEAHPRFAEAHYNLGLALKRLGRLDEAATHLATATEIQPANVFALKNLGDVQAAQGKTINAASSYVAALRIDPNYTEAQFKLGEVLLQQGNAPDAAVHFRAVLETRPQLFEASYQLGVACQRQGQSAEAIRHWRRAAQLKPDWVELLNNLAWVLATDSDAALRNATEAVRLAEHAVKLNEKDAELLDTLAAAYAESQQFADAVTAAQTAYDLMLQNGKKEEAEGVLKRLRLYRTGQPFRE